MFDSELDQLFGRALEDGNATDDDTVNACADLAGSNDSEVLRNTMRLYGGIFVAILAAFCILRRRFPRVYNLRNWVDDLKTDLAADPRGSIAWMWKLFGITDTQMMEECGMDALCYTRVLELGMKLSLVGILNGLWLIPVYATAESSPTTECISDWVVKITVSNLPSGSYRFCATVVGAYVVFGFTMYNILQEFTWFSQYRHRFLSKPMPRNYCVYVQCIPQEYQSNAKLLEFFQQVSSQGSVLEAHLAVKAPNLKKKVAEREKIVAQLEHYSALEELRGGTRTVGSVLGSVGGLVETDVQSLITKKNQDLQRLNREISDSIDRIDQLRQGLPAPLPESIPEGALSLDDTERSAMATGSYGTMALDETSTSVLALGCDVAFVPDDEPKVSVIAIDETPAGSSSRGNATTKESDDPVNSSTKGESLTSSFSSSLLAKGAHISSQLTNNIATDSIKSSIRAATSVAGTAASAAVTLLTNQEDGKPLSAGFVIFNSLRAAQAAQQMILYAEPFAMEVLEAPQPEDVFWKNVGKTHKKLQLGKLISFGLTVTLCFLWTIPMGFISTLSSIEGLRAEFEFVDEFLNKYPGMVPFLAQLAPLLIVVANEVLRMVLEVLSGLEGPISGAVVQAKLFTKLSSFMIIQTFFVTAIGGSIVSELSAMIQQPGLIIDLLAKTLPTQSTFYIQILLVDTFLNMGIELLRVVPAGFAAVRTFVGPRLTEKERSKTWFIFNPLCQPSGFQHANLLAGTVLYFVVYFVYAALAPITTIFMFICFSLMAIGYRNQFVYVYPTFPDSGGKLWSAFLGMLPACMIIAQVTIVGMLALNKAATASAMMIPLLIITILFTVYIQQKHFSITEILPLKNAFIMDVKNNCESPMDFDFLKDRYIQPELREREVLPEISTVVRETEHGCVQFGTPPGSEAGDRVSGTAVLDSKTQGDSSGTNIL